MSGRWVAEGTEAPTWEEDVNVRSRRDFSRKGVCGAAVAGATRRHYGHSPRGTCLIAKVPHGRWRTLTFLAAFAATRSPRPASSTNRSTTPASARTRGLRTPGSGNPTPGKCRGSPLGARLCSTSRAVLQIAAKLLDKLPSALPQPAKRCLVRPQAIGAVSEFVDLFLLDVRTAPFDPLIDGSWANFLRSKGIAPSSSMKLLSI